MTDDQSLNNPRAVKNTMKFLAGVSQYICLYPELLLTAEQKVYQV